MYISKTRKICRAVLLATILLISPSVGYAQALKALSGVVVDADDLPVPGVAVYDATKVGSGTITDGDGKWSLKVSEKCKELTFESLGYKTAVVNIKDIALVILDNDTRGRRRQRQKQDTLWHLKFDNLL